MQHVFYVAGFPASDAHGATHFGRRGVRRRGGQLEDSRRERDALRVSMASIQINDNTHLSIPSA